jgi:pyruvate dehydrogenase E2 component (dihydrolipoamide acetyltransferase)
LADQRNAPPLKDILSQYGPIESLALPRIQLLTARAMVRNWTTIPHVAHHDLIDVTHLEARRKTMNEMRPADERLSPMPFLIKSIASVLARLPRFNAALDEGGTNLIMRKYFHIGFAVDTPSGLLVAVIRDCDHKAVEQISDESRTLADKARTRGLALAEMSGSGFTVSSLGALGGTGFTPIINASEVAILGVSRLTQVPFRGQDGKLDWRMMMPVTLCYDHRVINGADAGRFLAALQEEIEALVSPG